MCSIGCIHGVVDIRPIRLESRLLQSSAVGRCAAPCVNNSARGDSDAEGGGLLFDFTSGDADPSYVCQERAGDHSIWNGVLRSGTAF